MHTKMYENNVEQIKPKEDLSSDRAICKSYA